MENIKKNFGFGCMRLPMKDGEVDTAESCRMVDAFLDAGFNYFDTAHGYIQGKSELALKDCFTSRYPRTAIFSPTSSPPTTSRRRQTSAPSLKASWPPAAWTTSTST